MSQFEDIVPKLAPFETVPYGKNRLVFKNPVEGTYLLVTKAETEIILGIDGKKTISKYLSNQYHRHQTKARADAGKGVKDESGVTVLGNKFSIKTFYNIIIELFLKGFLSEKNEYDLKRLSAKIPELKVPRPNFLTTLGGLRNILFRMPFPTRAGGGLHQFFKLIFNPLVVLVFIALSLYVFFNFPVGFAETALKGKMVVQGKMVFLGYGWFILFSIFSAILVLSFQNLVKFIAMIKIGREIREAGIRFRFGIPHFYVDSRDVIMAGPGLEIFLGILNVLAALFVGTVLNFLQRLGFSGIFFSTSTLVSLGIAFWGIRPLNGNPLSTILHRFIDFPHLKDHSHHYLKKRFLPNLFSWKRQFKGEWAMVIFGTYFFAWSYGAFYFVMEFSRINLPMVFNDAGLKLGFLFYATHWSALANHLLGGDKFAVGLIILACLVGFSMVFSVTKILLQNVFHLFGVMLKKAIRRLKVQKKTDASPGQIKSIVSQCPLFSELSNSKIEEIIGKFRMENYPAKSEVVIQGEKGDRFFIILEGQVEVIREENSGVETRMASLGIGDSFGEIALLENIPRTATIRTLKKTSVLSLQKKFFREFVRQTGEAGETVTRIIRMGQFLKNVPLFKDLPSEQISRLIKKLTVELHLPGEMVIKKGEEGSHFFMVKSGELEVLDEINIPPVATLREWDSFGEIALLNNIPRTVWVRVKNKSELYVLKKEDFLEIINHNIYSGIFLEEISRERLSHLQNRVAA